MTAKSNEEIAQAVEELLGYCQMVKMMTNMLQDSGIQRWLDFVCNKLVAKCDC